jgi:DNA polymerase III subunit gamma/tau
VLLRLIHAADMPDPASLVARLSGDGAERPASPGSASKPAGAPARVPADYRALVQFLESRGKHQLALQLHDHVGLVRYSPPELVLKPMRPLGHDWPRDLSATLKSLTGAGWQVSLSDESSEPSLFDQEKISEERVRSEVLADPNVRAVMESFPGAELESHNKGA